MNGTKPHPRLFFLLLSLTLFALQVFLPTCVVVAFLPIPIPMPISSSSSSATSPTSVMFAPSNPSTPPSATSSTSKRMMADDDDGATTRTTSTASSALHHGNPRSWILQVGGSAGRLCGVANSHLMPNTTGSSTINDTALVLAMTELLLDVFHASESLQLDLSLSIRQKMALNNRKYPVELCKGKAGKYTQYSKVTGVTVDNQSTAAQDQASMLSLLDFIQQVPTLVADIQTFAEAREWSKFHQPRNIILALLGEVGELAELVQWKADMDDSDNDDGNNALLEPKELDKLSQELADVSIYLLRLASVANVTDALVENLELAAN